MTTQDPYRISKLNLENIVYTKIKSNDTKKAIYIKYKDNNRLNPLVFQIPTLYNINSAEKNEQYYSLDIPLECQKKEKTQPFIKFLNDLDEKILYDAKLNSHRWFDEFENETMKYQKIIRKSNDDRIKNGMLRLKIIKTPNFETILQINNKNNININDIPVNSWLKGIIELYAIRVNNDGFDLFIRPILLSFKVRKDYNYQLLDDSGSEDNIDDILDTEYINKDIFIKSNSNLDNNSKEQESTQLEIPNKSEELNLAEKTSSDDNDEEVLIDDKTSSDEKSILFAN